MKPLTYAAAGVSLRGADRVVDRIRAAVAATATAGVIANHGGFAGLYALGDYRQPVLVSATDGVGTKLVLARDADRLYDAGIDCVAMSVNDVLCTGARPLLFCDYISCGRIDTERVGTLVEGIAAGCRIAGCALVGGETAEHPGVQADDDLDVAGFCVGVVERDALIDPRLVQTGDVVIGIASSGLHANGFALVRRALTTQGLGVADAPADLLAPTVIYTREAAALAADCRVHGLCHVTGGGIPGNLPRVLGGHGALIDPAAWPEPVLTGWLRSLGVATDELRRVFNCGLGFLAVVAAADAQAALRAATSCGRQAWMVGRVTSRGGVRYQRHATRGKPDS
jgi:phosphoribosylformylglycinamidine cyclo-ligase